MKVQVDPKYQHLDFAFQAGGPWFVDKTMLLGEIFDLWQQRFRYTCVTRPRRFGKTMAASMLASFFGPHDSAALFDGLAIAGHPDYAKFLNAYHVIYLDLNPDRRHKGMSAFLDDLAASLRFELLQCFPDLVVPEHISVIQYLNFIYNQTDAQFVFVVDEWDSVLQKSWAVDVDKEEYLAFLTALLKGQSYVAFAYMTGILPIFQYSDGSDLNMFADYTFINDERFDRFFGFTEDEVDRLFQVYLSACSAPRVSRENLDLWYNGYSSKSGLRLYNPRSVIGALANNEIGDYWGDSGSNSGLFNLVRFNVGAVLKDIEALILGETVEAVVKARYATGGVFETREQILSALVVYGLLTQNVGFDLDKRVLRIPNEEIRRKFIENIYDHSQFGGLHDWVVQSKAFKDALDSSNTEEVARIFQQAHTLLSPVKDYNRELELAHVLDWLLGSLSGNVYEFSREVETGNGFADCVLVPVGVGTGLPTYIFELKVGGSPRVALAQIKSRNYAVRFEQMSRLKGRIVAVGISYDPADSSKTHYCEMEILREHV